MTLKMPTIKLNHPSRLVLISVLAVVALAIYDETIEVHLCE